MDATKLRQLAAEATARARKYRAEGNAAAALEAFELAEAHREAAEAMERLQPARKTSTVDPVMTDSHREALSNSRDLNDSPPMRAARKAGYPSLRAVATALDADPGFLSKVFRGKRPCPVPLAEAIERLTGYPAARWKR